jgi:hypothetical protein
MLITRSVNLINFILFFVLDGSVFEPCFPETHLLALKAACSNRFAVTHRVVVLDPLRNRFGSRISPMRYLEMWCNPGQQTEPPDKEWLSQLGLVDFSWHVSLLFGGTAHRLAAKQ